MSDRIDYGRVLDAAIVEVEKLLENEASDLYKKTKWLFFLRLPWTKKAWFLASRGFRRECRDDFINGFNQGKRQSEWKEKQCSN